MEESGSLTVPAGEAGASAGTLAVGIAGTGFIGRVHARSALLAGGTLAGVSASTPKRAADAAGEMGAERAFASAEELVAAPDIDVVHVCVPNNLHLPLARAALEAGKHVVLEKPVALDSAEAEELVAAAERAGRVATVPFAYRYYPTAREARARIRAGEAGDIRVIQGGYLQDWLLRPEDDNWRVDPGLGGRSRAFADIGSHLCDLIEFVTGDRITALCARMMVAHAERRRSDGHSFAGGGGEGEARPVETEDVAALLFETERDAVGSLLVSQVSAGRKNRLWFEVGGLEAAYAFEQEEPESLWVGRPGSAERIPRDFATLSPDAARYVTLPGGHPQGFHDCFDAFVAETYDAIRGGDTADGLPTLADGARAVRLTDAVLQSSAERGWVEVP
ncbi:MAG TPA: Gfo/Idh/MocA family oxidoreductase [Solirubrobacterales bacterium]|nr:Gfo/Idh/MocA family oxidoreductase [Solirubrobacterales bacterium]